MNVDLRSPQSFPYAVNAKLYKYYSDRLSICQCKFTAELYEDMQSSFVGLRGVRMAHTTITLSCTDIPLVSQTMLSSPRPRCPPDCTESRSLMVPGTLLTSMHASCPVREPNKSLFLSSIRRSVSTQTSVQDNRFSFTLCCK